MNKKHISVLVSLVLFCSSALAQIPNEGLSAFYPLNGNAVDVVNGNDGLVPSQVIAINDRFGNANSAMTFDGEDEQFVFVPSSIDFDPSVLDSAISVSLWYKGGREDGGLERLVKREGYNGGYGIGILSSGPPLMYTSNSNISVEDDQADFPAGESWHHIVGVFQRGSWRLYFDGVHQDTYPVYGPQTISSTLEEVTFGDNFIGALDDIAFYRKALTAGEVIDLFEDDSGEVTGIETFSANDQIAVYPNPCSNLLHVEWTELNLTSITIVNILGESVFEYSMSIHNKSVLDLNSLVKGHYVLRFFADDRIISARQLIIE